MEGNIQSLFFRSGDRLDAGQYGVDEFLQIKWLCDELKFVFINSGKVQKIVDQPEKML